MLKKDDLFRMKKLYIIIFIFFYQASFSQISSLKIALPSDTITSFTSRIDSIKNKFSSDTLTSITNRLDSIQNNFNHQVDSVKQSYTKTVTKIQSFTAGYQQKIDSLTGLKLSTEKYTNKIDSLNQSLTALQEKVTGKLNSIKQKASDKIKDLPLTPELQYKVSQLTSKIEGVNLSTLEANLPGDLSFDKLTNTIPNLNASLNLPQATDLPQIDGLKDIGTIPDIKDIKNVTPDLNQVNGITNQATSLQGKIGDASGNLSQINQVDKLAETKAVEMSGISEMKDQTKVLDEYKDLAEQAKDPEAVKEQVVEKVQQAAINHFAGKEQQLQEAMETVAKYKKQYASVNDISKLPKKRPNEMKDKPLIERLVPGIAIQIQKEGEDLLVDFNPYVGYRFMGRITGGLGWNQRVAYNTKQNYFNSKATIYGPRAFGEYNLWKGFCPRAEVEVMNAVVPPLTKPATIDLGNRQWVWGVFVGLKKDYRFIGGVRGTAMIMTRLFDPHHKSPYADVINARFGFEFPMKKKQAEIK